MYYELSTGPLCIHKESSRIMYYQDVYRFTRLVLFKTINKVLPSEFHSAIHFHLYVQLIYLSALNDVEPLMLVANFSYNNSNMLKLLKVSDD